MNGNQARQPFVASHLDRLENPSGDAVLGAFQVGTDLTQPFAKLSDDFVGRLCDIGDGGVKYLWMCRIVGRKSDQANKARPGG